MALHITLYRGDRDTTPLSQDDFDCFDDVADAIEELVSLRYADRSSMLSWSPHRLRPGANATRQKLDVDAVTFLAIDIDGCAWDDTCDALEALNVDALVYGSPSDDRRKPEARRLRILTPLDRELVVSDVERRTSGYLGECGRTRLAFYKLLGVEPDVRALDCARLFYAGTIDGTAIRQVERFLHRP